MSNEFPFEIEEDNHEHVWQSPIDMSTMREEFVTQFKNDSGDMTCSICGIKKSEVETS